MNSSRLPRLTGLRVAVLAAALAGPTLAQDDVSPLKAIRAKDPVQREEAARALGDDSSAKAEAALVKAAGGDDDVLVQLACLEALGKGERSPRATKGLVKIALESPFTRVRRRAAEVLAKTDPVEARTQLAKKLSGKTFRRAAEALSVVLASAGAEGQPDAKAAKALVKRAAKGLGSKDAGDHGFAAGALVASTRGAPELRGEWIGELLLEAKWKGDAVAVACAALEAIAAAPEPGDVALGALLDKKLPDVVERRLELALGSVLASLDADARAAFLEPHLASPKEPAGSRIARLSAASGLPDPARLALLKGMIATGDGGSQAAAAHQLIALGEKGAAAAIELTAKAKGAPLELQLVRVLEEHGEVVTEDGKGAGTACRALVKMLLHGDAPRVREAAARALGRPGLQADVRGELERAADKDRDLGVRVVSTIALGRTRAGGALAALQRVAGSDDWRLRAAAAEGLKQLSSKPAVQPLIGLLGDDHAAVRATAHQALLRMSGREGQDVDPATWADWWKENLDRARFETPEEVKARAEKYGYGIDEARIYRGLDVVVVPGRGDHIESVLEQLGVKFRIAQAGSLGDAGLHPAAILLVGCTGEISPDDVEVVRWYVRSGGALFTSCWALTYTLEASFPSILQKSPTPGEVLDNVFARPTAEALRSPYLRGVFDGGVQPYYSLQGAHLISVVDPERAQVLLDSPEAAARHGSGVLAAWFRMGHGVVLNSANHFEEQGFRAATGLKKPIDRQAFAVNHMGLSLVQLRAHQDESWWSSTTKAASQVSDLSVFRILTNFVREKRIRG